MKRTRYVDSKRHCMDLNSLPKHDDMIVTSDDETGKLTLREILAIQFEMKELRKLRYFLGIEVAYSKQGIFISKRKYVLDLLKEIGKLGCKTLGVPIEKNHRIECEESPTIEKSQYQRLVGKLIYLSHTRLDIAYAISMVSQFMHDHRERHLQEVESILYYLKAGPGKGLLFRKEGTLSMEIYKDVDYARSVVDRRSTFGSKKQNVVTRSLEEAKFRAMTHGIYEGLWMEIILDDLKVKYEGPIKLFCDTTQLLVLPIIQSNMIGQSTKRLTDTSFKRITAHVSTKLQVVNVFTKGLPTTRFQELDDKLGMIDIHLPT
ncbi:Copia protein, partial [Mucuna pruriens]